MIKKISHIAIVVPQLDESLGFWVDALGLNLAQTEHVPEQDVDVAFLPVGESDIELLQPLSEESGVGRYLEKRGPGMHHICFEVDSIEDTLADLKKANVPLIDEEPTLGSDGKKIAFIHPKGTNGVLVELYELVNEEPEPSESASQRLRHGRQVYTAGAKAFFSRIRLGEKNRNMENDQ